MPSCFMTQTCKSVGTCVTTGCHMSRRRLGFSGSYGACHRDLIRLRSERTTRRRFPYPAAGITPADHSDQSTFEDTCRPTMGERCSNRSRILQTHHMNCKTRQNQRTMTLHPRALRWVQHGQENRSPTAHGPEVPRDPAMVHRLE